MEIRIGSYDPDKRAWSEKTIDVTFCDWDLSLELGRLRCWLQEHMVFERVLLLSITLAVIDYWLRRFLG
jgi:hypothetical protein